MQSGGRDSWAMVPRRGSLRRGSVRIMRDETRTALLDGTDQKLIMLLFQGDDDNAPVATLRDQDLDGFAPLHLLAIEGHAELAQYLIENLKADLNIRHQKSRQTPLHLAAIKNKPHMAKLLLEKNADPLATDSFGWTPLHAAARSGSEQIVSILIGALSPEDVNIQGPGGHTPLHRAAYYGHVAVSHLLVRGGADVTLCDDMKRRPYELACACGDASVLPELSRLLFLRPCEIKD